MDFKGLEKSQAMVLKMQEIMNTNPVIQGYVNEMAAKAEAMGMSKTEWEKAKMDFFSKIFFKLLLDHEDLRNVVADEVGRKIWCEAHQS